MVMKYRILILAMGIVGLISMIYISYRGKVAETAEWGREALLEDYDQVVDSLLENNSFLFTDKEAFVAYAADYRHSVADGMGFNDYYHLLTGLIEKVGCGHTEMVLKDPEATTFFSVESHHLPLDIRYIDGTLWIQDTVLEEEELRGSKVISINGNTKEAIVETMMAGIPSDGNNPVFKTAKINRWFSYYYFDLVEDASSFEVVYENEDGSQGSVTLEAKSRDIIQHYIEPGYMTYTDLHTEYMDGYAVLTLPHFDYYDEASFVQFTRAIDKFFEMLKEDKTENLILDLQGNTGGDPFAANYLYSYLAKEPYTYFQRVIGNVYNPYYDPLYLPQTLKKNRFDGQVYVLIDGMNFSTAGHLAALFKAHGDAVMIGQPTGASYQCTASQKEIMLENTHICLVTSTEIFRADVSKEVGATSVIPDVLVEKTFDDYVEGKNPALDEAVRAFRGNKE